MTFTRPDVYVQESLTLPSRRTSLTNNPTPVFIGTATKGPVTPTVVSNWAAFTSLYGGIPADGSGGYLPYAVYAYFRNGGPSCVVQRVFDSAAVAATDNLEDRAGTPVDTLQVDAKNVGAWGNSISVQVIDRDATAGRFDFVVYDGGTTSAFIVERFTDVTMDSTDARYVVSVVNNTSRGSAYITLTDLDSATAAPSNMPAAATTTLSTGDDGTVADADYETAVDAVDSVGSAMLLAIPGHTASATISAALSLAAGRGDTFCVLDTDAAQTAAQAVTYVDGLTATSYGAVYYPWVNIVDPGPNRGGNTKLVPPSGAVVGTIMRTDMEQGPFKTPAGSSASLRGVVSLEAEPTQADLGTLNVGHVNALRTLPSAGAVIYGGRTLQKTGTDRYVAVRRNLIYLRTALTDLFRFAVFQSNDENTWRTVQQEGKSFLSGYWSRGGLRGDTKSQAYYIVCDASNNTAQSISEGVLTIEVGVALQQPAEFVVLKIGQFETGEIQIEEV